MATAYPSSDINLSLDTNSNNFKLDTFNTAFNTIQEHINGLRTHSLSKLTFTYVVDSLQSLKDWANNVAGNDYTSVLIKKGEYELYTHNLHVGGRPSSEDGESAVKKVFNLTTTNTKVIVGEPGNKIWIICHLDGTGYARFQGFCYDDIPSGSEYLIKGLNVEISADWWNGSVYGDYYRAFNKCINIHDCNISSKYFRSSDRRNSYNLIAESHNIINCTLHNYWADSHTNQAQMYSCTSVKNCNNIGGVYSSCYSSPIAESTYACANTLNGGFNRVGTETSIENVGTSILKSLTTNSTACAGTDYIPISASANTSWGRRTLSSLFTYINSNTMANATNATYATNLGNSSSNYTYDSLTTALGDKVDKDGSKVLSDYNFSSSYKTTIDNLPADIGRFGKSTTSSSTGTKVVTFTNGGLVSIQAGSKIYVQFTNANTATSKLQLSINNVVAEVRLLNGTEITAYEAQGLYGSGDIVEFIHDGTYWRIRQRDTNPVGTIIASGGTTSLLGYKLCDGNQYPQTSYKQLSNAISTYFNSSSNSSTSSGFFRVPDLRETSMVGAGARGYKVTQHLNNSSSGLTRGGFLDDALQGHEHNYQPSMDGTTCSGGSSYGQYSGVTSGIVTDGTHGTPRIDYTTHGKILAVNFFIKYV